MLNFITWLVCALVAFGGPSRALEPPLIGATCVPYGTPEDGSRTTKTQEFCPSPDGHQPNGFPVKSDDQTCYITVGSRSQLNAMQACNDYVYKPNWFMRNIMGHETQQHELCFTPWLNSPPDSEYTDGLNYVFLVQNFRHMIPPCQRSAKCWYGDDRYPPTIPEDPSINEGDGYGNLCSEGAEEFWTDP